MTHKILDGISKALKEAFPDCVIFGDKRVRQGLPTPSFFVGLGECSTKPLPSGLTLLKQHAEVIYFPETQDSYTELWRIGAKALAALERIPLEDGTSTRGLSRRCTINDGLMHIHAVYRLRLIPTETIALMGDMTRNVRQRH